MTDADDRRAWSVCKERKETDQKVSERAFSLSVLYKMTRSVHWCECNILWETSFWVCMYELRPVGLEWMYMP